MASRGAAQMAALSRRMKDVPDESVRELVEWFIPRSEQVGGRMVMFGRVFRLSSKIKKRRRHQSENAVLVGGTPAAAWSIKSYGRTGGYPVKPRGKTALKLSSFSPGVYFEHVTVKTGTTGDRRWDRLVLEADLKFPDVVVQHIDRKVVS